MTPRTRSPNAAARFVPARSARFTAGPALSAVPREPESSTQRRPTSPSTWARVILKRRAASSTPAVGSGVAFRPPARFMSSATAAARVVMGTGATERLRSPRLRSDTSTAASGSAALAWSVLRCNKRLFRDQLPVARIEQRAEVVLSRKPELLHVVGHRLPHFAGDVVKEKDLQGSPSRTLGRDAMAHSRRVVLEDVAVIHPAPRPIVRDPAG